MGVENAEKVALWSQRMAAFAASGQPRRAWCQAQGLSVNTFGYWRQRLGDRAAAVKVSSRPSRSRGAANERAATAAAALVPVVVRIPAASTLASATTTVELAWPNGLRLTASLGVADLAALVRSLSTC